MVGAQLCERKHVHEIVKCTLFAEDRYRLGEQDGTIPTSLDIKGAKKVKPIFIRDDTRRRFGVLAGRRPQRCLGAHGRLARCLG